MTDDLPQAQFNGWACVEVMGHQQHIGYVRTEAYGAAVLFRIDTPGLPNREYTLLTPQYVGSDWCVAGSVVSRTARPGSSVLVGAAAIFRISPCTEEAALKAIDATERGALKLISLPDPVALPSPEHKNEEPPF
jgi:hypothetical protein